MPGGTAGTECGLQLVGAQRKPRRETDVLENRDGDQPTTTGNRINESGHESGEEQKWIEPERERRKIHDSLAFESHSPPGVRHSP